MKAAATAMTDCGFWMQARIRALKFPLKFPIKTYRTLGGDLKEQLRKKLSQNEKRTELQSVRFDLEIGVRFIL